MWCEIMQTKKQANLFLSRFACFKVGVTEVTALTLT